MEYIQRSRAAKGKVMSLPIDGISSTYIGVSGTEKDCHPAASGSRTAVPGALRER